MNWNNSWLQLAVFAAICSAFLLAYDFVWSGKKAQPASPSQGTADSSVSTASFPVAASVWTNSMGMVFKPVPGLNVLFNQYDTRVKDFAAFVQATGYMPQGHVFSLGTDGWKERGANWRNPGFSQTDDCPVVAVSWVDATAFCTWLTDTERTRGVLKADQSYRLPYDSEWSAAAGSTRFPWGDQWPPPAGSGNFDGTETHFKNYIAGYNDGYPASSPVGMFSPNAYGLYDMGGNVLQWCMDWYMASLNPENILTEFPNMRNDGGGQKYRVNRGSSWFACNPEAMVTNYRSSGDPLVGGGMTGFRIVVTTSP
jgi:formylglycine-generating enzyme required for sulfatase activity